LNDRECRSNFRRKKIMKKLVVSLAGATAFALCASAALAHGHVVTGQMLYATSEASQPANPAPDYNPPHKARVIHHKRIPAANTAS
jgi:hypothetical protein